MRAMQEAMEDLKKRDLEVSSEDKVSPFSPLPHTKGHKIEKHKSHPQIMLHAKGHGSHLHQHSTIIATPEDAGEKSSSLDGMSTPAFYTKGLISLR